jgi:hypothetical protein
MHLKLQEINKYQKDLDSTFHPSSIRTITLSTSLCIILEIQLYTISYNFRIPFLPVFVKENVLCVILVDMQLSNINF